VAYPINSLETPNLPNVRSTSTQDYLFFAKKEGKRVSRLPCTKLLHLHPSIYHLLTPLPPPLLLLIHILLPTLFALNLRNKPLILLLILRVLILLLT
jgi:hypothetical protein